MTDNNYNPVYYDLAYAAYLDKIEELVSPYLPSDVSLELQKLHRLLSLHTLFDHSGYEQFDWKVAIDNGWISKWDKNNFPELKEILEKSLPKT